MINCKSVLKNVLGLFLIALVGNSCIDIIDLTIEDKEEFLVVDGSFNANGGPHLLKLYYATGLRVNAQRPVSDAEINIFEGGTQVGTYTQITPGNYQLVTGELIGIVGQSYHIEIKLANGATYYSIADNIPEKVKGDSVFFDFQYQEETINESIIRKPFVQVFIATPLPDNTTPYWLKWEVNRMYSFPENIWSTFPPPPKICYIPLETNQQELNLFDGGEVAATYLPKWEVAQRLLPLSDMEFRGRHYYLVNQQSITEGAYNYWDKVNLVANQTGSIFDAPPAAIPGNIYNLNDPEEVVLGYFELANTDSLRGFFTESDFTNFYKFPNNVCADLANPFARNVRFCCACQLIENANLNRPGLEIVKISDT